MQTKSREWRAYQLESSWQNDQRWANVSRPYSGQQVVDLQGSQTFANPFATAQATKLWQLLNENDYVHTLGALTGMQALQQVAQIERGHEQELEQAAVNLVLGLPEFAAARQAYEAGDMVVWGGSMWVATKDTTAKPDMNTAESRAWKLCVKRGRDGKEGKPGPQGEKGADGRHGRDLTHLGPDGTKY